MRDNSIKHVALVGWREEGQLLLVGERFRGLAAHVGGATTDVASIVQATDIVTAELRCVRSIIHIVVMTGNGQ